MSRNNSSDRPTAARSEVKPYHDMSILKQEESERHRGMIAESVQEVQGFSPGNTM
ncbi:Hypothetical predicted protein [Scomber scombrus]|uniref:Uncharacterized protein n=1 Tax=Scomber scombrus TaxID=13677 RepID=A0AAV1P7N3_SCOSC